MMLFLVWLCFAGADDFINRKSRNWIALSGLFAALCLSLIDPKIHPLGLNFWESISSSITAFLIFYLFYKYRVMGAGDVKFGAALGALIGFDVGLIVWAVSCVLAVFHGFFYQVKSRYFFKLNSEINLTNKRFIPYVTYLAISTVIVLIFRK